MISRDALALRVCSLLSWRLDHDRSQNPHSRIAYLLTCYREDSTYAHAIPHHTEVGSLSGRVRCLLSGRLQPGIRFLRDPLPAAYSQALQRAYRPEIPDGSQRAYRVPRR